MTLPRSRGRPSLPVTSEKTRRGTTPAPPIGVGIWRTSSRGGSTDPRSEHATTPKFSTVDMSDLGSPLQGASPPQTKPWVTTIFFQSWDRLCIPWIHPCLGDPDNVFCPSLPPILRKISSLPTEMITSAQEWVPPPPQTQGPPLGWRPLPTKRIASAQGVGLLNPTLDPPLGGGSFYGSEAVVQSRLLS